MTAIRQGQDLVVAPRSYKGWPFRLAFALSFSKVYPTAQDRHLVSWGLEPCIDLVDIPSLLCLAVMVSSYEYWILVLDHIINAVKCRACEAA